MYIVSMDRRAQAATSIPSPCVTAERCPLPAGSRGSKEIRESRRIVLGDNPTQGGGAVFSRLLSLESG